MSNHPIFLDADTLTSQILFIFSLVVDNVEMINPSPFYLEIWYGKSFGVRNPKITFRRLKNKPVLKYLRFQVLGTFDRTCAEKYMWPDR